MIIKLAEGSLKTKFGEYHEILFYDGQKESIALILGDVEGAEAVLCRVHSARRKIYCREHKFSSFRLN